MTIAALDRRTPPLPQAARAAAFPDFEHLRLASGLEVLLLDHREQPLLTISYGHRGGGQFDPDERRGLASFTSALVVEGTAQRGASRLHDEIEGLGGFLGSGSGWDASSVSLMLLSEHADFALELLAEIVCQPAFDADEVERERAQRLSDIDRRRDRPGALASERIARILFAGTAYGGPLSGERAAVEMLTPAELAAFWHQHSPASGSFVVAAGDLGHGFLQRLEGSFESLSPDPAPSLPVIEAQPLERSVVHIVDRPQAAQTELRIGHVGVERQHPDRPALVVLNTLLGGKFTSRINLNLRERHGFTYGARSQFSDRRCAGPFVVSAAVETQSAGAASREVLAELRRVCDEPIEQSEIEDTQSYLLGVFPYGLQSLDGLAQRLEQIALYGLADDYYPKFLERLSAVTREDVAAAARQHLHPEAVAIVAAGPAEELVPQLEDLGPLEVHQLPESGPSKPGSRD